MKRIYLLAFLMILLSEGLGGWFMKMLKIEQKGYGAPIGFAVLLGSLQMLYYPAQIFCLSFQWILIPTIAVLLFTLVVTLIRWKEVARAWLRPHSIPVLLALVIFVLVLKRCAIDLDFSDGSTYLNYIAMNINAPHINLFDPTNGLRGQEWYLYYLFEGFFHFGSVLCWIVNIPHFVLGATSYVANMVVSVYGLGILYNVFSTMLIVNIVSGMKIRNYAFGVILLFYMLFYANFTYWDISFAFFGNTYRNLFVMLAIYVIYRWMKEDVDAMKYLLIPITAAALSCSSSSLFMCFAVLYALAAHLFYRKHPNALVDMTTVIIPMVAFVGAFVSRALPALSVLVYVGYTLFIVFRGKGVLRRAVAAVEDFFYDHAKAIFFIGIPALFAVGSVYFEFFNGDPVVNYMYYFNDFPHMDMTKDYIFLHSTWLDNLLNIIRWAGIILVIRHAEKAEDLYIRDFAIIMLVFFLNPLCINMLAKTITGMVFNRNFMTLFNPMTEIILFIWVYQALEKVTGGRAVMSGVLVLAVVLGNLCSFFPFLKDLGQYEVYIRKGADQDPIAKLEPDELNAIMAMKEAVEGEDFGEKQPVIVSQSGAALTYIPQAYQLFGPWNEFYPSLDDDFYQVARRHFDWVTYEEVPKYENTCSYMEKYGVNYVLLQYWENSAFDQALEGCTVTIYEGSKYKVRKAE